MSAAQVPTGDPSNQRLSSGTILALAVIGFYVVLWTVYSDVTSFNLDLHGDMVENYAWGINWQAGYFKHPPLFAWITAGWFLILPETDLAYRLLASLNVGVGLVGLWLLARKFLPARLVPLALCIAFFLPPLTTLAANYNANSGMIPFWAFILLAYLNLIERRTAVSALAFGVLAALGILMKYHTALLLLALVLHALTEKSLRPLLLSRLMMIVAAAYFVLLAPHIIWLFRNEFTTITYAESQQAESFAAALESALIFLPTLAAYCLPALLLLLPAGLIARRYGRTEAVFLRQQLLGSVAARALGFAAFGPVVLTLLVGLAMGTDISGVWLIPAFIFLPIYIAAFASPFLGSVPIHLAPALTFATGLVLLALAPVIEPFLIRTARSNAVVPVEALTARIDAAWSGLTSAPISIVGGETFLANAMSFYSSHHPRVTYGSLQQSPWVTPGEERTAGTVFVCRSGDEPCIQRAEKSLAGADSVLDLSLETPGGSPVASYDFRVLIKLPARSKPPAVN